MAQQNNIEPTVYVSGAPFSVRINTNQKVEQLIREALHQAGKRGVDPSGWVLRFEGGGDPIDPAKRVGEAGIAADITLLLDRDEGGGGNAPASYGAPPGPVAVLVAPEVSKAKVARQVDAFSANADAYRRRGIVLLAHEDLVVDFGFACRLPIGPGAGIAAAPLAVRLDFANYDVWAPSVDFIDFLTREPLPHAPALRGFDFRSGGAPARDGPTDVFIDVHPDTRRTFICKRGVREYHSHFEHNGDDWLLYRGDGLGTLAHLCDVLWRHTTRTVTGLNMVAQRLPVDDAVVTNHVVELRREDVDALAERLRPQLALAAAQAAALQSAFGAPGA